MELELIRTYFPNGTNGEILRNRKRICSTIELPWLRNKSQVSCIPEGRYELTKRYSQRHGYHLLVNGVPNRNLILFHVFNNALEESKGCIAPVDLCFAEGKGKNSKLALKRLTSIIYLEIERGKQVYLTIKSHSYE